MDVFSMVFQSIAFGGAFAYLAIIILAIILMIKGIKALSVYTTKTKLEIAAMTALDQRSAVAEDGITEEMIEEVIVTENVEKQ